MKKIINLLNSISIENLQNTIQEELIIQSVNANFKSMASYSFKRILILIAALTVPVIYLIAISEYDTNNIPQGNAYIFYLVNFIFVFLSFLSLLSFYLIGRSNRFSFLNEYKYNLSKFVICEISFFSYSSLFVLWSINSFTPFILIMTMFIYYIVCYKIVVLALYAQISEVLNNKYQQAIKINKLFFVSGKIPYVLLGVIVMGMYFFRTFKSVFVLTNNENFLFPLIESFGIFGAMVVGISISLLPLTIFDKDVLIRGSLLKTNAEYFRKQCNLSKKKWYGD